METASFPPWFRSITRIPRERGRVGQAAVWGHCDTAAIIQGQKHFIFHTFDFFSPFFLQAINKQTCESKAGRFFSPPQINIQSFSQHCQSGCWRASWKPIQRLYTLFQLKRQIFKVVTHKKPTCPDSILLFLTWMSLHYWETLYSKFHWR